MDNDDLDLAQGAAARRRKPEPAQLSAGAAGDLGRHSLGAAPAGAPARRELSRGGQRGRIGRRLRLGHGQVRETELQEGEGERQQRAGDGNRNGQRLPRLACRTPHATTVNTAGSRKCARRRRHSLACVTTSIAALIRGA
jgi:hypothetical protein